MKKIISLLLSAFLTATLLVAFSGCYNSTPAPMGKLVGTYKLTKYDFKYETEEEYSDYLAEKQIKAYLVVKDDGTGYYVYGDKDTAIHAEEVIITYGYETITESTGETDEYGNEILKTTTTENITNIRYSYSASLTGGGPNGHPGGGWETLGFDVKNKNLNVRHSPYHGILIDIKTYQSVEYTRFSGDVTLSSVEKDLGVTLKAAPFTVKYLNGKFVMRRNGVEEENNLFVIADIDVFTMKANMTFVDENGEKTENKNLDFSYAKSPTEEYIYNITIGDETYYAYYTQGTPLSYFFKRYESGSENYFYQEPNFDLDSELEAILNQEE